MATKGNGLWVRLSMDYDDDEAFLYLEHRLQSELLWVRGLAYCKRRNTDGFIPDKALPRLVQHLGLSNPSTYAHDLVQAGLWTLEDDGYSIPSWSRWQTTVGEQEQRRIQRSESGRTGGLRTAHNAGWHVDAPNANCRDCQLSNTTPPEQVLEQVLEHSLEGRSSDLKHRSSKVKPESESESESEKSARARSNVTQEGTAPSERAPTKPETVKMSDWSPTRTQLADIAKRHPTLNVERSLDRFRHYHRRRRGTPDQCWTLWQKWVREDTAAATASPNGDRVASPAHKPVDLTDFDHVNAKEEMW